MHLPFEFQCSPQWPSAQHTCAVLACPPLAGGVSPTSALWTRGSQGVENFSRVPLFVTSTPNEHTRAEGGFWNEPKSLHPKPSPDAWS